MRKGLIGGLSILALAVGMVPGMARTPAKSLKLKAHPVHCELFARPEYDDRRAYRSAPQGAYPSAPPPVMAPPPPPAILPPAPVMAPPPKPAPAQPAGEIVVSAQRVVPPAMSAPLAVTSIDASGPDMVQNTERYDGKEVAGVLRTADAPVSTFSVDVDTGSYTNARRMLKSGQMPPQAAVRTEEFINYFRYDYPRPADKGEPFSITTDTAITPWNANTRLMRIGLRAYDVTTADRPPANLVFLVDVSGSMGSPNKLDLVKKSLSTLAENLRPDDTVSIVVYASTFGTLLEPTNNKAYINEALGCMNSGGSTAGTNALQQAYDVARSQYKDNGVNRIFLATDGDFNVGVTDTDAIVDIVERERKSGITLTTLGFGTGNYNDDMMEKIADAGNGNYAYIDSEAEAQKVLSDELAATMVTVASDVKIQVEFNPRYISEYRLIGYENRALKEEDFDNDTVDAGDIGAGHQVTALYEVVPTGAKGWLPERRYAANQPPAATGADDNEAAYIKLRYKLPGGEKSLLTSRALPARQLTSARAPLGDFAFAVAIAAFGQYLRGDEYLFGFGPKDMRMLAGEQSTPWRREFVDMTLKAENPKKLK